jgi:hypothetical protein
LNDRIVVVLLGGPLHLSDLEDRFRRQPPPVGTGDALLVTVKVVAVVLLMLRLMMMTVPLGFEVELLDKVLKY